MAKELLKEYSPYLEYKDGVLHFDGVNLEELAKELGTPLYVYSANHIRDRIRAYKEAFPGALIAYGVAVMLFFHMAVNVAMNINLIPVTGLPLPFITYGGSALLSSLLGIGLVESVAMRRKPFIF